MWTIYKMSFFGNNIAIGIFAKCSYRTNMAKLFNFTQKNPIYVAKDPFALGFDASMVWGPIVGTMVYTGIRYKIN